MPKPFLPDVIPTLNGRGFMFDVLDPFSRSFIDYAGSIGHEVLDIGCAYGVATLPALAAGGHVVACDMEPGHLEILESRVPSEYRNRLRTCVGTLPEVDFPSSGFGAILSSRMFHFLTGEEIQQSVGKMFDWLAPGGKLFLVADTPYMPPWNTLSETYEKKKRDGDPWPGFIPDFFQFLKEGTDPGNRPPYLNPLDPDILSRECRNTGFLIEQSGFVGMQRDGAVSNGKEHAGCIVIKPN